MTNKTTTLSIALATLMYQGTDEKLKAFALENYPELGMTIMERVKSFEDACVIKGISPTDNRFTNPELLPHEIATRKVETLVEVLNEEWVPNWHDNNQRKYYPWFKMSSSGSGFACVGYGNDNSITYVGSRQVFKTRELAVYAGQQFNEIYKQMKTL